MRNLPPVQLGTGTQNIRLAKKFFVSDEHSLSTVCMFCTKDEAVCHTDGWVCTILHPLVSEAALGCQPSGRAELSRGLCGMCYFKATECSELSEENELGQHCCVDPNLQGMSSHETVQVAGDLPWRCSPQETANSEFSRFETASSGLGQNFKTITIFELSLEYAGMSGFPVGKGEECQIWNEGGALAVCSGPEWEGVSKELDRSWEEGL
ncbi:hypothetical protein A6R68_03829 [Neotoma lepida]|uniref:Uncharacterized protein n=1 Tax=Neotoma lepida TaxID=56216 RepID=A0A1A6GMZ5_NEOLE|nr:hypothetical protein A6R68_03829 [Neotoma lepida]